ncbi:MAG: hypothetical protein ING70_00020 [Rhodocyclaceae bacterium]|nr:hypothetical protein [Rhodocyclaceae bacterium]MCA3133602.1 hypothetical protein [Rhodocyclaceae bacterium]MCA3144030.1 hypothetical protein [Rhodocyclaceae bacterium]
MSTAGAAPWRFAVELLGGAEKRALEWLAEAVVSRCAAVLAVCGESTSFADPAAFVESLDLLMGVDWSLAHLAN